MQLSTDLRQWLEAQLTRGCHPEDMVDALITAGYEPDQARASVAFALRQPSNKAYSSAQDSPKAAGQPEHALGKTPQPLANGGHVIQTSDKPVRVVARLAHPPLLVLDGLLSHTECDALIEAARPKLLRSHTIHRTSGETELNSARTSAGTYFHHDETPLLARLNQRIAEATHWPLENSEPLQILHYPVGAQYEPHYDYFDPADPGTAKLIAQGGHRIATLIIYLNDPEAGGATIFPDIGVEISAIRGNAVFFSYDQPTPASLSLHGGSPVTAGEKWIATRWMRERPYR